MQIQVIFKVAKVGLNAIGCFGNIFIFQIVEHMWNRSLHGKEATPD
jgi:hypothetical protein